MLSPLLIAYVLLTVDACEANEPKPLQRFERSEIHMGASFGIVLYAEDEKSANRAFDAAFARVEELNRVCSDYDSSSEVSQLCAQSPTQAPVQVSADLFLILAASQDLSARSDGAFDVTVGPLTKLWRRARQLKVPPNAERIKKELQSVGYQAIHLDRAHRTVELRRPDMRIDLGAIAKGYAADEALRVIRQQGLDRALVNASGNLAIGDAPPGKLAWRIDIAGVDAEEKKPVRTVWLANMGIATAGDKFQFLEHEGKRYSHILDPRTGYGITGRSSVTVIAPSGMLADALDTTVAVMGVEKGLRLIEETPGVAAYIESVDEGPKTSIESQRFAQWLKPPASSTPESKIND